LKSLDLLDLTHCDWTAQENFEVLTDTIVSAPSLRCIGIAHQQGPKNLWINILVTIDEITTIQNHTKE